MDQAIRVFIISHYGLFVEGLSSLIKNQGKIELVGSSEDAFDLLNWDAQPPIDILLISTYIEDMRVIQMVQQIKTSKPDIKLVVLGVKADDKSLVSLIEAGVCGYVPEGSSFADLAEMLEAVHRGETPCSPKVAASVFKRITELSQKRKQQQEYLDVKLTPREKEILEMIAAGLGNKEIAHTLGIRVYTVKNHVHNILGKLHVNYRREAIRFAYENGLIQSHYLNNLGISPSHH